MYGFSESFKQVKAPWLARPTFSTYGSIKDLLNELFKNYHDYGNSPSAAAGATEHICAQDPNKIRIIREAKQLMVKSMSAEQQAQTAAKKEDNNLSNQDSDKILATVSSNVQKYLEKCKANLQQASDSIQQQQQN